MHGFKEKDDQINYVHPLIGAKLCINYLDKVIVGQTRPCDAKLKINLALPYDGSKRFHMLIFGVPILN